jgi:Zn-dependent metalloprotease
MKKVVSLLLITLCLISNVFAQKASIDPRSHKGLDASKIPALTDWNSFRAKTMGKKLTDHSVHKAFSSKQAITVERHETIQIEKSSTSKTQGLWKVLRSNNGTVNWMWRAIPRDRSSQKVQSVAPAITEILTGLAPILKLNDPKSELSLMSDTRDELGLRHVRYAQMYKAVPVWNRDLYVHINSYGEVTTINGTYEPSPSKELSAIPSVSSESAIAVVTNDLKAKERWAPVTGDAAVLLKIPSPSSKLVFFPEDKSMRLAYEVEVFPNIYERYIYVVDAKNGEVIRSLEAFCSLTPRDHKTSITKVSKFSSPAGSAVMPLAGFTNATGTDLNNQSKSMRVYQHSDGQYYSVWDLPNLNAGQSQLPNSPVGGAITLTLNNKDLTREADLFHVTSSNNNWSDKAGVSAHANMKVCFDYYSNTFGRKAIDDQNSLIISIIHATDGGVGMDNAFWTGKLMIYGDGATEFKPLAGGLDVAGHEMTHGVIEHTANLVYEFQSGALNESCADVFGIMIDPINLQVGEDVMKPGKGTCLRDLLNPANPGGLAHQPTHMNEFNNLSANQDNGGVHVNSGIPNRAAALIVNAIGREKTAKIYYNALKNYMTRNSQFIDCRLACEKAATDLFGNNAEFNAVQTSFATVGIGGAPTNNNENDVPAQTGGKDYIAFLTGTGSIGVVDTLEAVPLLFTDPAAVARVSSDGSKAQLTAPRTGTNIWFVDEDGFLNYIIAATGEVRFFPNLKIQETGDLWNAAVAPDESYVALSSDYAQDPNIYIFDGTSVSKYELAVEGGDGTGVETIQYPDVMSWSPNKNNDKLSFDAYNEEELAGTSYSYWSMYEMNFGTKKIYNLIPAQPEGISVGNIIYSNTDPDVVAFNIIGDNGVYDIALANFETGDLFELSLYNNTINGSNILDADKPSFSPNDNFMTFASVANKSLLFLNGANLNLTYLQFQAPLYNPYWFLFNGSADVKEEPVYEPLKVNGVYPSVFMSDFTISFSCDKRMVVECDLLNIFGQRMASISSGAYLAGESTIGYSNNELASGTYFVRLYADGKTYIRKVVKQ